MELLLPLKFIRQYLANDVCTCSGGGGSLYTLVAMTTTLLVRFHPTNNSNNDRDYSSFALRYVPITLPEILIFINLDFGAYTFK